MKQIKLFKIFALFTLVITACSDSQLAVNVEESKFITKGQMILEQGL